MLPRNQNALMTGCVYDDAGRLRKTVENCASCGGGNASSGQCVDKNRTTRCGYNQETVTIRDRLPATDGQSRFIRLRV